MTPGPRGDSASPKTPPRDRFLALLRAAVDDGTRSGANGLQKEGGRLADQARGAH